MQQTINTSLFQPLPTYKQKNLKDALIDTFDSLQILYMDKSDDMPYIIYSITLDNSNITDIKYDKDKTFNIVYFHGNNESIFAEPFYRGLNIINTMKSNLECQQYKKYRKVHFRLILFEYPGYFDNNIDYININILNKWCTDITYILKIIIKNDNYPELQQTCLFGYSLGASFVIKLLPYLQDEVELVYLEAMFLTLRELIQYAKYKSCTASFLLWFWNNKNHEYFDSRKNLLTYGKNFYIICDYSYDDEICGNFSDEINILFINNYISKINRHQCNHSQFLSDTNTKIIAYRCMSILLDFEYRKEITNIKP